MEMIKNIMKIINNLTPVKSIRHFAQNIFLFVILGLATLTNAQTNSRIWTISQDSSWEDLKLFLPKAKMDGISVWVYLMPPTKSPSLCYTCSYSEPFRLDFIRWAEEIAKLSLRYSNVKGYAIVDLYENINLGYLRQIYIDSMISTSKSINPRLQFDRGNHTSKLYYVSIVSAGDSSANSWANKKILSGFNWSQVNAGDTVFIDGGTDSLVYNYELWPGGWNSSMNGVASSKIVVTRGIDATHNGVPVFYGTGDNPVLCVTNRNYIEISRMRFRGDISTEDVARVEFADGIDILYNEIWHPNGVGVRVGWSNNTRIMYDTIRTGEVANAYDTDGIYLTSGANVEIAYNYILQTNAGSATPEDDGHKDLIQTYLWQLNGGLTKIHHNFFSVNNIAETFSAQGVYLDDMAGNYEIYNNVFVRRYGWSGALLSLLSEGFLENPDYDSSVTAKVYNNSFYGTSNDLNQMVKFYGMDTLIFKNNLIMQPGGMYPMYLSGATADGSGYVDIDYNQYLTSDTTYFAYYNEYDPDYADTNVTWYEWRSVFGHDAHGEYGEFTYADSSGGTDSRNYRLVNGSNGIDKGIPITLFDTDIEGTLRPQGASWDRGAFEFKD